MGMMRLKERADAIDSMTITPRDAQAPIHQPPKSPTWILSNLTQKIFLRDRTVESSEEVGAVGSSRTERDDYIKESAAEKST